jgi:hypothetical protein
VVVDGEGEDAFLAHGLDEADVPGFHAGGCPDGEVVEGELTDDLAPVGVVGGSFEVPDDRAAVVDEQVHFAGQQHLARGPVQAGDGHRDLEPFSVLVLVRQDVFFENGFKALDEFDAEFVDAVAVVGVAVADDVAVGAFADFRRDQCGRDQRVGIGVPDEWVVEPGTHDPVDNRPGQKVSGVRNF